MVYQLLTDAIRPAVDVLLQLALAAQLRVDLPLQLPLDAANQAAHRRKLAPLLLVLGADVLLLRVFVDGKQLLLLFLLFTQQRVHFLFELAVLV